MNDLAPTESKQVSASGRAASHRVTRRRAPLSCVTCRVRKLKCNREKPCQNCIVRGDQNACSYTDKVEKNSVVRLNPRSGVGDMRQRLNRLEDSIISMMSNDPSSKPFTRPNHSDQETNVPLENAGQTIMHDTKSTHWDTVLSELGAMKEAWSEENNRIEYGNLVEPQTTKSHRPGLLAGLTAPPNRATIVASTPSKEASDRLIDQFFGSYNPAIPARYVLHRPTFFKQSEKHWKDPSKTKIMWIGLLFSVYTIAMHSYIMANDIPSEYDGTAPALKELYRVRTVQCLLIADITKPTEFMIETINIHSFAEYSDERDGDKNTTLLSSLMMRLALQQGYHRDPSHHLNITIFQGEMRRRIWSAVSQHELLFSAQLGLPKALRNYEADTESPRNLHEEELYEDMTVLPPSRPLNEDTEVSYQVVKYRLMRSWGRVIDFHHVICPQPYAEVLKLDKILLDVHVITPAHLTLGYESEMKDDAPARVVEKYILDIFYHKAVVVLHRRYWKPDSTPGGTAENARYSRQRCVSSAIRMLQDHETIHVATAPGGSMVPLKWFHFSITNHDFLLAAMVLCLDVMQNLGEKGMTALNCAMTDVAKFELLKRSCDIWQEIINDCPDATRAVRVLTTILNKIETKMRQRDAAVDATVVSSAEVGWTVQTISNVVPNESVNNLRRDPYFVDQYGLGQSLPGNETNFGNQKQSAPLVYPSVPSESNVRIHDGVMDGLMMPVDFNWDCWDQFMVNPYQGSEQSGNVYPDQDISGIDMLADGFDNMNGLSFMDFTEGYSGSGG